MRTSRNEKREEEEEKKKKGKLATRYLNAMLRTALKTRAGLHKCYASHRIQKKGKLATRYLNAMLRTALIIIIKACER
jgi:hypothetical protein